MRNYKHLVEDNSDNSFDDIMTKNLPSVSLRNPLTTNIILSMEMFLKSAFSKIMIQRKYFSH